MACSSAEDILYNGATKHECDEFRVRVAKGEVPGHSTVRKYGSLKANAATGRRVVWEFGDPAIGNVTYTYPADGSATIDTVSSSSAADTGPFVVQGLDVNGDLTTQQITWRCFRAYSLATTSTPVVGSGLAGQVFVYEDTAIVAGVPTDKTKVKTFVNNGNNQTLQAFYTIPSGYRGLVWWSRNAIVYKGVASALSKAWIRPYGYEFRLADEGSLHTAGTSVHQENDTLLTLAPALTDIAATADVDTNGTIVTTRFDIVLIQDGY